MTILSHNSLRSFVARLMLSAPEEGLEGAIEAAAVTFDLHADDVRAITTATPTESVDAAPFHWSPAS